MPYSMVSFRGTLSDLAIYSMTCSIAQPLCESRANCLYFFRLLVMAIANHID